MASYTLSSSNWHVTGIATHRFSIAVSCSRMTTITLGITTGRCRCVNAPCSEARCIIVTSITSRSGLLVKRIRRLLSNIDNTGIVVASGTSLIVIVSVKSAREIFKSRSWRHRIDTGLMASRTLCLNRYVPYKVVLVFSNGRITFVTCITSCKIIGTTSGVKESSSSEVFIFWSGR